MARVVTIKAPGGWPAGGVGKHGPIAEECDLDPDVYAATHDRDYLDSIGYLGIGYPVLCHTHGLILDATPAEWTRARRRQQLSRMTLEQLDDYAAMIEEARAARQRL